jgi:Tfp pilus assembly protein PilZ
MNSPQKKSESSAVTKRLVGLIIKMPLGEQEALLEEIERRRIRFKRRHSRKTIRTLVDYSTDDRAFKDFTQDISAGGVFIQTHMPFRVGEDIALSFFLPMAPERHIKIGGQIVRTAPTGIGVEFRPTGAAQEQLAQMLMEMIT